MKRALHTQHDESFESVAACNVTSGRRYYYNVLLSIKTIARSNLSKHVAAGEVGSMLDMLLVTSGRA